MNIIIPRIDTKVLKVNKHALLSYIYYDLNLQQSVYFQVHDKDGLVTKWRHYLEVQSNDWLISKVNHRSILPNEIILDYDGWYAYHWFNLAISQLKKDSRINAFIAYKDPMHIHVYIKDLMFMSKVKRQAYRTSFIQLYNADSHKNIDRCMIALEFTPHWKRGQVKDVLDWQGVEVKL